MKKTKVSPFILLVCLLSAAKVIAVGDETKQLNSSNVKEQKSNQGDKPVKPIPGVRPCVRTHSIGISEIKRSKYETLPSRTKETIMAHPDKYKVVN